MKKLSLLAVALLAICLLPIAGCLDRRNYVPLDKRSLKGSGKVYFVPLGDFPVSTLKDLVSYYQTKYDLAIEILSGLPLNSSVRDVNRQQLIAEAVIALMKGGYTNLARDPKAILIGLTTEDMYIAQYNWQFTFSWRQEGKYAVVSNARMKLGSSLVSEEKLQSRLRKMVTKNIGILYYRLPPSDDPRSVLYKNVGDLSELDYMGEEF